MIDCICNSKKDIPVLNEFYALNYNSDNINSMSHTCYDLKNLKTHISVCNVCTEKLERYNIDKFALNTKTSSFKVTSMIFLFYSNNMSTRNEMFDELNLFLKKWDCYGFVNLTELNNFHYIFWKISLFLIVHGQRRLIFLLLDILRTIKKNERHGE